jgi:putative transcriptional regulator
LIHSFIKIISNDTSEANAMIKYNLKALIAEKEIRENRNITYREISSHTGISKVTLSKIAQRKGYDTAVSIVERLCLYFKCTPNELISMVPDLPEGLKKDVESM